MGTQTVALLVQAAGTILLFAVLLLLYRKFRRPAFLDWIASWGFFLIGTGLLPTVRDSLSQTEARQIPLFAVNVAMLAHVYFLVRGVQRFRSERGSSRPVEMLWALPILVVSWIVTTPLLPPATIALIRAGA